MLLCSVWLQTEMAVSRCFISAEDPKPSIALGRGVSASTVGAHRHTLRHCRCPWDGPVGHAPHPSAVLPQWNNFWEGGRQGTSRTSTAVSEVKMLPRQGPRQGCFWGALATVLCYHFLHTEGSKSETWCLACLNPQGKLVCLCNTSAWHNKLKCYREAYVWGIRICTFVNQTYTISH